MIADNNMIQKINAKKITCLTDLFCDLDIGSAGSGISARMVVDKNKIYCMTPESFHKNFSWSYQSGIDSTF